MGMRDALFEQYSYGKIALKKMGTLPENFYLFSAKWLGDYKTTDTMELKGAQFREAKRGPNKGKLSILVKGTERTAYVTTSEMKAFEAEQV